MLLSVYKFANRNQIKKKTNPKKPSNNYRLPQFVIPFAQYILYLITNYVTFRCHKHK